MNSISRCNRGGAHGDLSGPVWTSGSQSKNATIEDRFKKRTRVWEVKRLRAKKIEGQHSLNLVALVKRIHRYVFLRLYLVNALHYPLKIYFGIQMMSVKPRSWRERNHWTTCNERNINTNTIPSLDYWRLWQFIITNRSLVTMRTPNYPQTDRLYPIFPLIERKLSKNV